MTLHVINGNGTNSYSSSEDENNAVHIIQPRNRNNSDLLQQFTQWDQYVTSSHGSNTPRLDSSPRLEQNRFTTGYAPLQTNSLQSLVSTQVHSRVKTFPSIRSKDFTSNQELNYVHTKNPSANKTKSKRHANGMTRFIFHRGFLRRSSIKRVRSKLRSKSGPKFRNQNEFNSCLNYIDLVSMVNEEYIKTGNGGSKESLSQDITDLMFPHRTGKSNHHTPATFSNNVVLYKPENGNKIVVNKVIPRDIYMNRTHQRARSPPLSHHNNKRNKKKTPSHTIKRKLSQGRKLRPTSNRHHQNSNHHNHTIKVKRSSTLPASMHSTTSSYDKDLKGVWSQYLQAVIAQRIAVRMTLLNSEPASTYSLHSSSCYHDRENTPLASQERIKNY